MPQSLNAHDALLIVDVQNDFCGGGALPVPEGDAVIEVINNWIRAARRIGARVYASRDWHPGDHVSFQPHGGPWPVHCVHGTAGAQFHPDLDLPSGAHVVSKATTPERDAYSAFDGTNLAVQMRADGIARVWIGGLALDVCVTATALDAIRAGFETHVILAATRAVNVNEGDEERALDTMRDAGVIVEEGPARA